MLCRMQNQSLRREEAPEDIFLFICSVEMLVLYTRAQKIRSVNTTATARGDEKQAGRIAASFLKRALRN